MKAISKLLMAGVVALSTVLPAFAQDAATEIDPQRAEMYANLKGKKVVFLSQTQTAEHGQVWYGSMKKMLEPLGIDVELRDFNWDTNLGTQMYAQAIAQGANVIALLHPDRASFARLTQQAHAAGIYTVALNMGSNEPSDLLVGPDWIQMITMQLQGAIDHCGGKGKISLDAGGNNSTVDLFGAAAIKDLLAKYPDIKIVNDQFAQWDPNKAHDITAAVLQQNPDLCGIIGYWSTMDQGAAAAVKEAGLQDQVYVATNGSGLKDGACDKVKDGTFDMYVSYSVDEEGRQVADVIKALLSSGAKPGDLKMISYTTLTPITKDNADKPGVCWSLDDWKAVNE